MTTDSTERPESRWTRRLRMFAVPAAGAVVAGALGGGAFYYFTQVRRPAVRHSNPTAARHVATTHVLLAIDGGADATSAVALIGKTNDGSKILTIPASTVLEVPGIGPRSVALVTRQSGAQSAAVAIANSLRITVPSAMAANATAVAATLDDLGGLTVTVPKDLREHETRRIAFSAGPKRMNGDAFVRFMTGSFAGESVAGQEERQQAGWRALLSALASSRASTAFDSWTSDVPIPTDLGLLRSCAQNPSGVVLPVTPIGLIGDDLVRIDEGRLPRVRRVLSDFTNGAETLDGRRVRLVVGASGAVGSVVGRILVNAGYVIEMSGKSLHPVSTTTIAVSSSEGDAKATGEDVASLLGRGQVRVSTDISADADIILTVGMDWAETNGFPQR